MNQSYAYIRVSSKDQNEERQVLAMKAQGIEKRHIYMDKQSGKDFNRPGYQRMVRRMRRGDILFIASIDRLGRNYEEILEQWRTLTHDKGIGIVVLDMPLLDTRQKDGLLGAFISDLVLQLLSFVAENERNNIRSRQKAGIEAAQLRGVHLGRPRMKLPEDFDEICRRWEAGEISAAEAARQGDMSTSSFRYRAKCWQAEKNSCEDHRN